MSWAPLAGLLCSLAAVSASAADEANPDTGFLEFLGSWADDSDGDEWLDFLESLSDEERAADDAKPDTRDEHKTDDKAP